MSDIHIEVPVTKVRIIDRGSEYINLDNIHQTSACSEYDLKGVTQLLSNYIWTSVKEYSDRETRIVSQRNISLCDSAIDCMFNTGIYEKGIFILSSKNLPESWPVVIHYAPLTMIVEVGVTHTPQEKKLYIPFMGNSNFGLDITTSNIIQAIYPEVIGRRLNLQMILEA